MLERKIIPAILTDSLEDLKEMLSEIELATDVIQVDYVDGYFAPELTCCEAHLIQEIEIHPALEVHLMAEDPGSQIEDWKNAGAARLVGHIEEMEDQVEFVEGVSKLGMEVGLALNLETPLGEIDKSIINGLDAVLLMGHEVGIQRATFQKATLKKIAELRALYPNMNIEVDGGVNADTIEDIAKAGANLFAVGSAIFESDDPRATLKDLTDLISL